MAWQAKLFRRLGFAWSWTVPGLAFLETLFWEPGRTSIEFHGHPRRFLPVNSFRLQSLMSSSQSLELQKTSSWFRMEATSLWQEKTNCNTSTLFLISSLQNRSSFRVKRSSRVCRTWLMRSGLGTYFLLMCMLLLVTCWRPVTSIRMFNQQELQILLGGVNSPIDLVDLRQHTSYGGLYDDQEDTIQAFWNVVDTFDQDQRRALLRFATSCSRPPLLWVPYHMFMSFARMRTIV